MDEELYRRRVAGLEAGERSNIREGLPPRSEFARAMGERYARKEITSDEGIAAIMAYHRAAAHTLKTDTPTRSADGLHHPPFVVPLEDSPSTNQTCC